MKPSEDDAMTELREALNIGINSPPRHTKSPQQKTSAIKVPDGTDSGYSSNDSSQRSTPDSTPDTSAKAIYVDGILVERSWTLQPKKMKLQLFESDSIPQPTWDRFRDLRQQYTDPLFKYIREAPNPKKVRNMGMSLEFLGENRESAAPWVLIQCKKGVAKKVRGFFKQAHVEAEYKPAHPTVNWPYLRILVHEEEPDKLAGWGYEREGYMKAAGMMVYGDPSSMVKTLCGSEIVSSALTSKSTATIGGLVRVVGDEYPDSMYALTAGHFLDDDEDEDDDDDDDDDEEEANDLSFDDNDSYELDLELKKPSSSDGSIFFNKECLSKGPEKLAEVPKPCSEIGRVFRASYEYLEEDMEDKPNLDWALIDISDKGLYLPNIVSSHEVPPVVSDPRVAFKARVIFTTAKRGLMSGTMSNAWSHLSLSPGNGMARMYILTLGDGMAFQHGDSGAWVTNASTNQVYGHIVAADAFGRAYVVPLCDTFADIKSRLGSKSIELPSRDPSTTATSNANLTSPPMPYLTVGIPELESQDTITIAREIAPFESVPMTRQMTRHPLAGTYLFDTDMLAQALNQPTQAQNSEGDFNLLNFDESYNGLLQPTAMDYTLTTPTDSSSRGANRAAYEEFHDSGFNSFDLEGDSVGVEDSVVFESELEHMANPPIADVYQFHPLFRAQMPSQPMFRNQSGESNDSGYASGPQFCDLAANFAVDNTVSFEYNDDFTFPENETIDETDQQA